MINPLSATPIATPAPSLSYVPATSSESRRIWALCLVSSSSMARPSLPLSAFCYQTSSSRTSRHVNSSPTIFEASNPVLCLEIGVAASKSPKSRHMRFPLFFFVSFMLLPPVQTRSATMAIWEQPVELYSFCREGIARIWIVIWLHTAVCAFLLAQC